MKRKRKKAAKRSEHVRQRVELSDALSVDVRIRWLIVDVMRLQNQYAELQRSLQAISELIDLQIVPRARKRQRKRSKRDD